MTEDLSDSFDYECLRPKQTPCLATPGQWVCDKCQYLLRLSKEDECTDND